MRLWGARFVQHAVKGAAATRHARAVHYCQVCAAVLAVSLQLELLLYSGLRPHTTDYISSWPLLLWPARAKSSTFGFQQRTCDASVARTGRKPSAFACCARLLLPQPSSTSEAAPRQHARTRRSTASAAAAPPACLSQNIKAWTCKLFKET